MKNNKRTTPTDRRGDPPREPPPPRPRPRGGEAGPHADVVVVGVPFDSAVTYRPGARFGPNAIRQGSRLIRGYNPELDIKPFDVCQFADAGDIACNPFDIGEAVDQIAAQLTELLSKGTPRV